MATNSEQTQMIPPSERSLNQRQYEIKTKSVEVTNIDNFCRE